MTSSNNLFFDNVSSFFKFLIKERYNYYIDKYYDYLNNPKIDIDDKIKHERQKLSDKIDDDFFKYVYCESIMYDNIKGDEKTPFSDRNPEFRLNTFEYEKITNCSEYYIKYWTSLLKYTEKYGHQIRRNRMFYRFRHEEFKKHFYHFGAYTKDTLKYDDRIFKLSNFVKKE